VIDEKEAKHHAPGRPQPAPSCPTCKTPARYVTSMLDVQRGRSILIFRCDDCREDIWQ
jgi:hypothetical protein